MPSTNIHSKWIMDPNLRATTMKLLEEIVGVNACDPRLGNGFLDMTAKAQAKNKKKKKGK